MILFTMAVFIVCSAGKSSSSIKNGEHASLYQIKKIKNEKTFYIIYAVRNDSTFKIISHTDTVAFNCKKIKTGNKYTLELKKIFPDDTLFGMPVFPNLGIKGYSVNGVKVITLEKEAHNKIYTALNLSGLCIINDNTPVQKQYEDNK